MNPQDEKIAVGILGQWSSGKSTAARILIEHLGGEGTVIFLNDQHIFASLLVKKLLDEDSARIVSRVEGDGRQRLATEYATIWLRPGEELQTVDVKSIAFDVPDETLAAWLNKARISLAHQLRERLGEGKPIVIEAGFGAYPADHTISDLFLRLEEAGLEPKQVKWILIEASFEKRAVKNARREFPVPAEVFAKHAVDGGGLNPADERRLEDQGTVIRTVRNDLEDINRFKSDVIATFESI